MSSLNSYIKPIEGPTPEEMFERSLRELIRRHVEWRRPPTREEMTRVLQREARRLKSAK